MLFSHFHPSLSAGRGALGQLPLLSEQLPLLPCGGAHRASSPLRIQTSRWAGPWCRRPLWELPGRRNALISSLIIVLSLLVSPEFPTRRVLPPSVRPSAPLPSQIPSVRGGNSWPPSPPSLTMFSPSPPRPRVISCASSPFPRPPPALCLLSVLVLWMQRPSRLRGNPSLIPDSKKTTHTPVPEGRGIWGLFSSWVGSQQDGVSS